MHPNYTIDDLRKQLKHLEAEKAVLDRKISLIRSEIMSKDAHMLSREAERVDRQYEEAPGLEILDQAFYLVVCSRGVGTEVMQAMDLHCCDDGDYTLRDRKERTIAHTWILHTPDGSFEPTQREEIMTALEGGKVLLAQMDDLDEGHVYLIPPGVREMELVHAVHTYETRFMQKTEDYPEDLRDPFISCCMRAMVLRNHSSMWHPVTLSEREQETRLLSREYFDLYLNVTGIRAVDLLDSPDDVLRYTARKFV